MVEPRLWQEDEQYAQYLVEGGGCDIALGDVESLHQGLRELLSLSTAEFRHPFHIVQLQESQSAADRLLEEANAKKISLLLREPVAMVLNGERR